MRFAFALTSFAVLIGLTAGCGSTTPSPARRDAALTAVVAYVDTEVEIAADAGACRDDLGRGRAIVAANTAMCVAGFAQTLSEGADAVADAAGPVSGDRESCATSRAALRQEARGLGRDWRHVIDLVRRSATANVGARSATITTAVAAADEQADAMLGDTLTAFTEACLSGTEARRAKELADRHRGATHSSGQTI